MIIDIKGQLTGWPVWLVLSNRPDMYPHPVEGGVIECSMVDTRDRDFWRADPQGLMYLIRRFQEDTREIHGVEPETVMDLSLPVWRTGECLLHAHRFASRLGAEQVDLTMRWEGLRGRTLVAITGMRDLMPGRVCQQGVVESRISVDAASIPDALPELVRRLTEPLYDSFDFFQPSDELYATELTRLRKGI